MKIRSYFLLIVVFELCFTSCATYYVSTDSLLQQFAESRKEEKVNYLLAGHYFVHFKVIGNDLNEIKCLDKEGKEKTIQMTNHTGIRITKKDSTHVTFYFDTLLLQDSIINGKKSHFVGFDIKPIKLDEISLIEILK